MALGHRLVLVFVRAFGAQNPTVRRWWPRRYRRSSFYWKLVGYDQRFGIADRIEARHGRPPLERVVQDVEVPLPNTENFLTWFLDNVPIEPVWLCPLRLRDDDGWPLYPLLAGQTYVNIGFWSSVPSVSGSEAHEQTHRTQGFRTRRTQVAVFGRLLHPRGVRRPLRRGVLQHREEDLRSRFATARSLRKGGTTAMTTFKADGVQVGGPVPGGKLSLAEILRSSPPATACR